MRVHHPNAVRETVDDVDDAVTLGGESVAIDDDGTLEAPSERAARNLAERYGLDLSDIRASSASDADTCQEVIESGDRAGEVCGRDRPCRFHD